MSGNGASVTMKKFAVLVVGLFVGKQSSWLDHLTKQLTLGEFHHYVMIVDAGSTGTRVTAYQFAEITRYLGSPDVELKQEVFYETDNEGRQSLSSCVNDTEKAAKIVAKLIRKVQPMIPLDKRNETIVLVRGTAGLRLLPPSQSQRVLDHVKTAISELGYRLRDDAVGILDSDCEGIYGWYTVNLLLPQPKEGTTAALDLGGSSVEITQQLNDQISLCYLGFEAQLLPAEYKHDVPLRNENVTLFSHSYLNMGLLAARLGIFQLEAEDDVTTEFESSCVDPVVQNETWIYRNKKYAVSGAPRSPWLTRVEAYDRCLLYSRQYVLRGLTCAPPVGAGRVAGMGFLHQVAADSGLVEALEGGISSIEQFHKAALRACSASNVDHPWECIDLTYIIALLTEGFKIGYKVPLHLQRRINNHDVSWVLGLAYNTVMNKITDRSWV